MTILIVDDEFRIGQLIRRLIHFEELGLELIDVFDDSEKALGAILLHHPDVVISDIKMPGMDGLELVRRTQEAGIASRFVFVSGFREFEYAHKALQYGVEDYLLKPVKEEDLNNILQKLSDGHEQVLQHRREEKQLQEEARRGRYIRGFDLIQAIESAGEWVDWQDLVRQIQSNSQNDPALYYTLARCFLNTFYGDLTWDERRTRQCRNWLEQVRHCWQLPQLNELVEQAIAEELQTQQKELDNQTARPVRMALDYIAENYAQKIGLDEIAEMLQMNSSYFSTLFKKETGRNFQNYLTEYRIEKAKELLRTTNETMMSVAEQVGYQDTRYFSQCFVKVVGVKPSLYRKMYS